MLNLKNFKKYAKLQSFPLLLLLDESVKMKKKEEDRLPRCSNIDFPKRLAAIQLSFRRSVPREGYTTLEPVKFKITIPPGNFPGRGGSKGEYAIKRGIKEFRKNRPP